MRRNKASVSVGRPGREQEVRSIEERAENPTDGGRDASVKDPFWGPEAEVKCHIAVFVSPRSVNNANCTRQNASSRPWSEFDW